MSRATGSSLRRIRRALLLAVLAATPFVASPNRMWSFSAMPRDSQDVATRRYQFEAANYWGFVLRRIDNVLDPQVCARLCDQEPKCVVASYHDARATGGWANACVLHDGKGERHTEQIGITSWVKPAPAPAAAPPPPAVPSPGFNLSGAWNLSLDPGGATVLVQEGSRVTGVATWRSLGNWTTGLIDGTLAGNKLHWEFRIPASSNPNAFCSGSADLVVRPDGNYFEGVFRCADGSHAQTSGFTRAR
jgi:hypothetical protein